MDLAEAQREVREAVTNAWTALTTARAAATSASEGVQAAELAYEGVTLEQETGLRSTVEVLDTEEDLLNARIQLAQAQRVEIVAERQLLAAIGILSVPTGAGAQIEGSDHAPRSNHHRRGR